MVPPGVPLSFTFRFDPGRVEQQVQRTLIYAIGDGNVQRILAPLGRFTLQIAFRAMAAAQNAEVRYFPVNVHQPQ